MIQTLGQISDNVGLSELMWHQPLFAVDIQPVSFNIIILHSGDCILVRVLTGLCVSWLHRMQMIENSQESPAEVHWQKFVFSYGPNILNSWMYFSGLHVVHLWALQVGLKLSPKNEIWYT
jgi:hypothetical protein